MPSQPAWFHRLDEILTSLLGLDSLENGCGTVKVAMSAGKTRFRPNCYPHSFRELAEDGYYRYLG